MTRLTLTNYTAISLQRRFFFAGAVTAVPAVVVAATETRVFIGSASFYICCSVTSFNTTLLSIKLPKIERSLVKTKSK